MNLSEKKKPRAEMSPEELGQLRADEAARQKVHRDKVRFEKEGIYLTVGIHEEAFFNALKKRRRVDHIGPKDWPTPDEFNRLAKELLDEWILASGVTP